MRQYFFKIPFALWRSNFRFERFLFLRVQIFTLDFFQRQERNVTAREAKKSEGALMGFSKFLRNPCVLRSKNKNQRTRVSQNFAKQNEKLISAHYRLLAVMIHRRCPQNFAVRSSVRLAHKNLTWEIVVNAHYGFKKISAKSWAEKIKNKKSAEQFFKS